MAYDFQNTIDDLFFGSESVFGEQVTGIPNGGSQQTLYVNIVRDGALLGRMRGGHEAAMKQTVIDVSKTNWPSVTKNKDTFSFTINGETKTLRVVSIISEDDFSYRLALA